MSMVRIHNHIIDLSKIIYIDNVRHNKSIINYTTDTGVTFSQTFATEEEALYVTDKIWSIFCSRDNNPIDITPDVKKQGFKTFADIEAERIEELESENETNQ